MVFLKELRERIRRGEITSTIRIWQAPRVRVGRGYPMEQGHIVVDSLMPIRLEDITGDMARQSGFKGVVDLLKVAHHGTGRNVYLIKFHYVDGPSPTAAASAAGTPAARRARP